MSSQLFCAQTAIQGYCNNCESALWVLLWTALQYTPTSGFPGLNFDHDLALLMGMFNETAECTNKSIQGGMQKLLFLQNYLTEPILFKDRPAMHSLVETLTAAIAFRYAAAPTVKQVHTLEGMLLMKGIPALDRAIKELPVYIYQQKIAKFYSEGWLVKTIRDHLAKLGWPMDDKPSLQKTLPLSAVKYHAQKTGMMIL